MLTTKQREMRRKHLGASDTPAILGISPITSVTPTTIFWSKQGADWKASTESTELGNMFEAPLVDWAAEQEGVKVKKSQYRVSKENKLFAANYDALGDTVAIEGKVTSMVDEWGDDEDEVPQYVAAQCLHQLYVSPHLEEVIVPVLLVGKFPRRKIYRVKRNDVAIEAIVRYGKDWWEKYVVSGVEPDVTAPVLHVLKNLDRVPSKIADVPDQMVDAFLAARDAKNKAKQAEDAIFGGILRLMVDAEAARCSHGMLTYFKQQRKGYTVEPGEFRVARWKPHVDGKDG